MLASGKPVIATCRSRHEIADVVSHCGMVVPPEDGPALAEAIEALADDTNNLCGSVRWRASMPKKTWRSKRCWAVW